MSLHVIRPSSVLVLQVSGQGPGMRLGLVWEWGYVWSGNGARCSQGMGLGLV